ncbi:fanconi-associated nuclease 1-like isoform X2 [Ornithodoros turicata]|uniref:fanconi-associated nuclease 1-like isoform X2 n=1 Tax=Ornithodoros turicata TaxID=34597 RepID=UPI003139BA00
MASNQSRITNFFTVNSQCMRVPNGSSNSSKVSQRPDIKHRLSLKHKRGSKESTDEQDKTKKLKFFATDQKLQTAESCRPEHSSEVNTSIDNSVLSRRTTGAVTFDAKTDAVTPQNSQDIGNNAGTENTEAVGERVPYYLESFTTILNSVKNSEHDWDPFLDEEKAWVAKLLDLNVPCQKLYIRLLQRKHDWKRLAKITYPDINKDLRPLLRELHQKGFLENATKITNLQTALDLLGPAELKTLAKFFKLKTTTGSKTVLIKAITEHGSCHKSVLGKASVRSIDEVVLKQASKVMGEAYRLADEPRNIYRRILMLFSLGTSWDIDDERSDGTSQLYFLLLVSIGKMSFPQYRINCKTVIFSTRDDFLRFETARSLEADLIKATENKKWDDAYSLFLTARQMLRDPAIKFYEERDEGLPQFLRHFSPCYVYTRCLSIGVDVVQRLKKYVEAVDLLRSLLSQDLYCQSARGRWWDRMALNLDAHLNQAEQALHSIRDGLSDPRVRPQFRYSLYSRAEKILSSSTGKNMQASLDDFPEVKVCKAPEVTIEGRLIPRKIPGRNHLFMSSELEAFGDDDDVRVVGVEELALEHYVREGYMEGVHGEGSTFQALFALLCWDVIYDDNVCDVFRTPYQAHPLDLNSDTFFESRERGFVDAFEKLSHGTIEELQELISTNYEKHSGEMSLVQWDKYTCPQLRGLVKCFGGKKLSLLCERLARDYRHCRSGLPDLVVWNVDTGVLKAVEVKGPGDILSSKQVIWLDYLLSIGIDSEVCRIKVSPTEPSTVQPTNVTTVSPGTRPIPEFQLKIFTCSPTYYNTYYMDRRRGFLIVGAKDALHKTPLKNINDTVCGRACYYNYIKFILPLKEGSTLFVCGTNARSPAHFEVYADAFTMVPDQFTTLPHQAEDICSPDFLRQGLGLWVGADLFTATATKGSVNEQAILRTRLIRNDTSSSSYHTDLDVISTHGAERFMKAAQLKGMFAIGEHVYIFFQETPLEIGTKSSNLRKSYSRIARLCKNDRGGGQANSWTSFLKVRLTCVLAEAHVKYFDFLEAIYNIPGEDIIYGIFSNRFTGEYAICSFQLSNITDAFNGAFLKPPDPTIYPDGKWIDVDEADVPQPRPGQCVSDSRTLPVDVVSFIDDHPLLAIVIQGDASYVSGQMAALAVVKVKVGGTSYSVIYTGDRDGIIYQIVEKNPQTNNVSELVDTFPAFIKEPIWKIDISKERSLQGMLKVRQESILWLACGTVCL